MQNQFWLITDAKLGKWTFTLPRQSRVQQSCCCPTPHSWQELFNSRGSLGSSWGVAMPFGELVSRFLLKSRSNHARQCQLSLSSSGRSALYCLLHWAGQICLVFLTFSSRSVPEISALFCHCFVELAGIQLKAQCSHVQHSAPVGSWTMYAWRAVSTTTP